MASLPVSPRGERRIYQILCTLAASDGVVDEAERAILRRVAKEFGISPGEARALAEESSTDGALKVGKNPAERELLIELMIEVALADGVLDREERKRLLQVGAAIGLPSEVLKRRVRARQAHASQEAEARLKTVGRKALELAAYAGHKGAQAKTQQAGERSGSIVNFVSGLVRWGPHPLLVALVAYARKVADVCESSSGKSLDVRLSQVLQAAEQYAEHPGPEAAHICGALSLGAETVAEDETGAASLLAGAIHKLAIAVYSAQSSYDPDGLSSLASESVSLAATAVDFVASEETRNELCVSLKRHMQEWALAS